MATPDLTAKIRIRNNLMTGVGLFFFALALLLSPACLGEVHATTFQWKGKFNAQANTLRRPPKLYDWIAGFWDAEIEGKLEKEVILGPDKWIRFYSITSVSFIITFRYKSNKIASDPYTPPTEYLSEIYTHLLNTSNFNLSFDSWENVNDFNNSFIAEYNGFPSPGYSYQIFLKYDERESLITPKGSKLQLGGGTFGQAGGFQIPHYSYLPDAPAFWPANTHFYVPDGYENVNDYESELNWCGVYETQSLSPSFTFSGYHDATTKNLSRLYVNTAMVDEKPLAGGLIRFDGAGMIPLEQGTSTTEFDWVFDGGELMWYDGDSSKPVVRFIKPRKYTVTLNTVSDLIQNNLMCQRDIDLSLEAGDLIFIRTPGWTGPFDLINQCYTHVGMYVGDGVMIEAAKDALAGNLKGGVQLTPISRWGYLTEVFATAYRVNGLTLDERKDAVRFAIDRLGLPYESPPLTKQLFGDKYYCSELVWAAYYAKFGIDLGQTGGDSFFPVSPDAIANDIGNLTFIGGHWEHDEPKLSKGKALWATIILLLP
jgi:uncharacterized protein YycO